MATPRPDGLKRVACPCGAVVKGNAAMLARLVAEGFVCECGRMLIERSDKGGRAPFAFAGVP